MSYRVMVETTKWSGSTPNHTYLFDSKMDFVLAYRQTSNGRIRIFKKPFSIDRRGRTFRSVSDPGLEKAVKMFKRTA